MRTGGAGVGRSGTAGTGMHTTGWLRASGALSEEQAQGWGLGVCVFALEVGKKNENLSGL